MFDTLYQEFIYKRTYSRWLDSENRREDWEETVNRYKDFFVKKVPKEHVPEFLEVIKTIKSLNIMPSMRALWTSGKALERDNLCSYNCAYLTINTIKSFADMLYILMNGTGVGFSVERQYINELPTIPKEFEKSTTTIVFADSKRGWAEGYFKVLKELYKGKLPKYDLSKIRPAGARLKVFGGLASGSGPLEKLIKFTTNIITHNNGRKLSSINCYDICCMISNVVVVGSVRRSATVSFSNLSDSRMSHAKRGAFWIDQPQRALSNNSVMYTEKPDSRKFLSEWIKLIESKTGERGIFNREGAKLLSARNGRRNINYDFGGNACLEIILRPNSLCNLSEVMVRKEDTLKTLKTKIRYATIIGCLQSTLTDFKFVSREWKQNCVEERLLGVSLTGEMDHPVLNNVNKKMKVWLHEMKEEAIATAEEWSKYLDINMPTAITAIKPSGCRPFDGLVTTESGIFTLEDLLETHTSYSDWDDLSGIRTIGGGEATKTFINGIAPVSEIKMSLGMKVQSTPNHKWFVKERGWMRTDQLEKNDQIEVVPNLYTKDTETPMLSLNPLAIHCRTNDFQITQPETMSPDLAWLLGYLWGDGAMSPMKYRLRWIDAVDANLVKAQHILKEIFNLNSSVKSMQGRNCRCLEVGSKVLWHWLIKNGVWKYYATKIDLIPKVVRTSSKESVIAFIGGLIDADGWCGKTKLIYTTASKFFANHVQHVGWSVGICLGNSKNVGGENFQKKKEMYLLSLLGNSNNTSLDILVKHCRKVHTGLQAYNPKQVRRPGIVKEVYSVGNKPTYDIETDKHWFFAGSVKSHNTASQLTNTASGIHTRYSPYYIRRVRVSSQDPLAKFLVAKGVPVKPETGNTIETTPNYVFEFPIKSPKTSRMRDEMTTLQQLEMYKVYMQYWIEHNISTTIYVRDNEWPEVAAWVYKNWDTICGLSFLPYDTGIYELAPYEEITEEEYEELENSFPKDIDFKDLDQFETEDTTEGAQTLACTGNNCEI